MKNKSRLLLTSLLLLVSIFATTAIVSKLRQNQTTSGTPVGAANLDKSFSETFPDFPVYPDAKILSSKKELADNSLEKYSASWIVGGDNVISQVANWYLTELGKKGWTKIQTKDEGPLKQEIKMLNKFQSLDLIVVKGEGDKPFAITIKVEIMNAKK